MPVRPIRVSGDAGARAVNLLEHDHVRGLQPQLTDERGGSGALRQAALGFSPGIKVDAVVRLVQRDLLLRLEYEIGRRLGAGQILFTQHAPGQPRKIRDEVEVVGIELQL